MLSAPRELSSMTDLRKKFKVGDLVAQKYTWHGESTQLYIFRVTSFEEHIHDGDGFNYETVGVFVNGKWEKNHGRYRGGWMWYYNFEGTHTGDGWHKAYKYRGRIPAG